MKRIVTILLTHQSQESVVKMREYWRELDPDQDFVIAYGGKKASWQDDMPDLVLVDDPALRTRDHPRERQSYQGVFQAAMPRVNALGATHVHLAEFDEIPVVKDLNVRLLSMMEKEKCDVLGHRLFRVDDTTHPHALDHLKDPQFLPYWQGLSCRPHKGTVLSMLGCGSFWTRECFEAVAQLNPPLRIYLELFLPTAAHHLGYRVRPMGSQDHFMDPEIMKQKEDLASYRSQGAWRVHPVKRMWLD
jgi:hypothetical protein